MGALGFGFSLGMRQRRVLAGTPTPTPTPGPFTFGVASQQNHEPNTIATTAFDSYAFQKLETIPKAITGLKLGFLGFYTSPGSTSLSTDNPTDFPLKDVRVSIGGAAPAQVLFGALPEKTIVAGSAIVWSDAIGDVLEGQAVRAMGYATAAAGTLSIPYTSGLGSLGGGLTRGFNIASGAPTFAAGGMTVAAGTSVAGNVGWVPIFAGTFVENDVQVLIVDGNSQSQQEDSWIQQVAASLGWPILNLAISASKITAGIDDTRRQALFALGNQGIVQQGRNDFPSSTVAALSANVAKLVGLMKARGVARVGVDEIPPYTSSASGQWLSGPDQTTQDAAGSGAAGQDEQFNAGILSIAGVDYKTTRDSQRDPGNPRKWVTNGAANYPTGDGKHATVAIEALKSAENKSQIATAAQIAKANAEALTLTAEASKLQGDKTAAQTATTNAGTAGANVTRLQARINAIIVNSLTTFTDPMGSTRTAGADIATAGTGWTAAASYVPASLLYLGSSNGTNVASASGGTVTAPKQGDTVRQFIQYTSRSATGSGAKACVLYVDENNYLAITAHGQTGLTRTRVSLVVGGVLTDILFVNAVNSASGQVYKLSVIPNGGGGFKVELQQNATVLAPVTAGQDDITSAIAGGLSSARLSGFGCRSATVNPFISTWSNGNLA